ncbi:hypothetical protein HG530_012453 [Fusarium avenaceum]|nr:hypothetical protein HG530_012453 [Fusarium avenaceum]
MENDTLAGDSPLEAHIEERPPLKKNKAEDFQSLKRKTWGESEVEDVDNSTVPHLLGVGFKDAERIKEVFLSLILTYSDRCTIWALGQSWCFTQVIGPALQPCQIVSQNHYHRYPSPLQEWERFFADDPNPGPPQVSLES